MSYNTAPGNSHLFGYNISITQKNPAYRVDLYNYLPTEGVAIKPKGKSFWIPFHNISILNIVKPNG